MAKITKIFEKDGSITHAVTYDIKDEEYEEHMKQQKTEGYINLNEEIGKMFDTENIDTVWRVIKGMYKELQELKEKLQVEDPWGDINELRSEIKHLKLRVQGLEDHRTHEMKQKFYANQ